jgi:hypothetical protein
VLYCGTHLLLNRPVAIKVFDSEDAEFVVRSSKQNMRESQQMQKVLASNTAGDIGYVVFDLNQQLSADDFAKSYALQSVADDYVKLLQDIKAIRTRRIVWRSVAAAACVGIGLFGAIAYGNWAAQKRPSQGDALLARVEAQKTMTPADLSALENVVTEAESLSPPLTSRQKTVYRAIATYAWSLAGKSQETDPNAAHDAALASFRLMCIPTCLEPKEMHAKILHVLSALGDKRKPQWLLEALAVSLDKPPYAMSPQEKADIRCFAARYLAKCGRDQQAKEMFDANVELAQQIDPVVLTANAITDVDVGNDEGARRLVARAMQFAKNADARRDYCRLRQMFQDLYDMDLFDSEAESIGRRILPVASADPAYACRAYYGQDMRKIDGDWEVLVLSNQLAAICERQGRLDDALAFFRTAQKWTSPDWPSDWDVEAKKPAEGIARLQGKLARGS